MLVIPAERQRKGEVPAIQIPVCTPELAQHSEEEGQGDGQADGGPDHVEGIRVIFDKIWFLQCRLMIIRLRSSLD